MFLKSYGVEKLLDNKVSRFCRLFLSHSAEKFVENPPMIQKIRAPKKPMHKRGVQLFSVEKILVSQNRRTSWGNAFVFQKNSSTEKVYG